MLFPYIGHLQREHLADGSPHTLRYYGADRSGTKEYRFNSLGFRGEEYSPAATKRIFVCGCSYTIGVGLDLEETWAYRFKYRWAMQNGWNLDDVNLLNFSQGGASNDYILRTLISQLTRHKPDLVLVLFTHQNRAEYLAEIAPNADNPPAIALGPWCLDPGPVSTYFAPGHQPSELELRLLDERRELSERYYIQYTDLCGTANSLKNILMLQMLCTSLDVGYVFSWVDYGGLLQPRFAEHPVIAELVRLLHRPHFCAESLLDLKVDVAADGHHPGPASNTSFGDRMFERAMSSSL